MYLQHKCAVNLDFMMYYIFLYMVHLYSENINPSGHSNISHAFSGSCKIQWNAVLSTNIKISLQVRLCLIQGFIAIFLLKNSFLSLRYFPQNFQHLSKSITQDTDLYAVFLHKIVFIYQIFLLLFLIFTFLFTFHLHSF